MKKLSVICMMCLAVLAMVSCTKRGPEGPVGPQGPMGPQGPAGNDGNANVASSTLTVYPDDWYLDNGSWRVDFDYDAINSDIYESGAVLVYMETEGTWRQIPMTFYYSVFNDAGEEIFLSSSLETSFYQGGVSVFWTESDFYEGYRPEQHKFRIVAIAASYYKAHPDLDYSNYEAVREALLLED